VAGKITVGAGVVNMESGDVMMVQTWSAF
jgi:hypothetical protein